MPPPVPAANGVGAGAAAGAEAGAVDATSMSIGFAPYFFANVAHSFENFRVLRAASAPRRLSRMPWQSDAVFDDSNFA